MRLAEIVHVELVDDVSALDRNSRRFAFLDHCALASRARLDHPPVERRDIDIIEQVVQRLHLIVPQVRDHAAEGGGDAGEARHQHRPEANIADQGAGVQCTAAAERHSGKFRGVVAAFDRHQPDRAGHARIGDPNDGRGRGVVGGKPERLADMRQDGARAASTSSDSQFAAERALPR